MTNDDDRRRQQEQLEQHSLPGTNQAGKGASRVEGEHEPGRAATGPAQEQLEKHSLPGTNQAGKGPGRAGKDGKDQPVSGPSAD